MENRFLFTKSFTVHAPNCTAISCKVHLKLDPILVLLIVCEKREFVSCDLIFKPPK